jgi:hypothetical protein
MKKTSRSRSPARFLVPAILFIMAVLFGCAIWNTSLFDIGWILLTFVAAAFITFLIIAPQLLPIEDDKTERRNASRAFRRFLFGGDQYTALIRDGQIVHQSGPPLSSMATTRGILMAAPASSRFAPAQASRVTGAIR